MRSKREDHIIHNGLTMFEINPDMPPREMSKEDKELWWRVRLDVEMKEQDPMLTSRERWLLRLSISEYVSARRAGQFSCEEYARLVVRRARYYRNMNQWIYRSYSLFERTIDAAMALDLKAAAEGIDAIAPLYGLPIPVKGTMACKDFPSGAGSGVLSGYTPVKDSAMVTRIKQANGVIFGTTNVPPFAFDINTKNNASGQTRNPYHPLFSPGGSSGGAASAVASYMCPVAVSEDTGGSTRIPAWHCQLFGFDPARNHYDNTGNTALSFTKDQIGVVARSMEDILLYDQCLMDVRHGADDLHIVAQEQCSQRPPGSIRIGTPKIPFLERPSPPPEWCTPDQESTVYTAKESPTTNPNTVVDCCVQGKYDRVKEALRVAGMVVVEEEWPEVPCRSLGNQAMNQVLKSMDEPRIVNGKPFNPMECSLSTSGGQTAQWVWEYLDAPLSLKELAAEEYCKPGVLDSVNETQFRYYMGPYLQDLLQTYNAYFDAHAVDFLLIPAGRTATPDLPITNRDPPGYWSHFINPFKELHIPKLLIPTGLSEDGRPVAVQLWGRAVAYEDMFDDARSSESSIAFLHLAAKVVEAIHAEQSLRRVEAALVSDLFQ